MKTYYLIVFFFFLSAYTYSQNIYYGYPENTDALKKGDIIILNIPEHINGRYNKSKELDRLINFLCLNKHNIYKIEINLFWGTAELNVNYTKSLCNNLKELLDEKSIKNYKIKFNGNSKPIFLDKSSKSYKLYNTRLEIIVE